MKYLVLMLMLPVVCVECSNLLNQIEKCFGDYPKNNFATDKRLTSQKYCVDKLLFHYPRLHKWIDSYPDIKSFDNKGTENAMVMKGVRKEYRMLTSKERDDFHRAINLLKQDTVSFPIEHLFISFNPIYII